MDFILLPEQTPYAFLNCVIRSQYSVVGPEAHARFGALFWKENIKVRVK
jgi:hypothetical protein